MTPTQGSLFDAPRAGDARTDDPWPSKRAAGANLSARQTQKKEMLRRLLQAPASARGLADVCGGQVSRASKRLGELRDAGLVRGIGFEYQPAQRGGVPATVYCLTDDGKRNAELMGVGR